MPLLHSLGFPNAEPNALDCPKADPTEPVDPKAGADPKALLFPNAPPPPLLFPNALVVDPNAVGVLVEPNAVAPNAFVFDDPKDELVPNPPPLEKGANGVFAVVLPKAPVFEDFSFS
ncbi:hypothetical protein G6F56_012511 [Rhizopus delemar]|nr:hypothetical protein G6F56_012511 [Rhizopus delemar]